MMIAHRIKRIAFTLPRSNQSGWSGNAGRYSEGGERARSRAVRVADDHVIVARMAGLGIRQTKGGIGCPKNCGVRKVPLIGKRRVARCSDTKDSVGANQDGPALWLLGNRWRKAHCE